MQSRPAVSELGLVRIGELTRIELVDRPPPDRPGRTMPAARSGARPEVAERAPELCRLQELLGRVEPCPGSASPLWRPGDGTHEGRCSIAHVDLAGRPEAAAWLLRVRRALETAGTPERQEAVWHQLAEACDLIARSSRAARRH